MKEKLRVRLTKKLIEAADKVDLRKLKIDHNPKNRRIKFMHFIENIINIFALFSAIEHVIRNYPTIAELQEKYSHFSFAIFTILNICVDLEAKEVIKESNTEGIMAIHMQRDYCARITPQDQCRCEEAFNSTKQFTNETTSKYIGKFRDAKLLAKSVGTVYNNSKLIDKFLNSIHPQSKYAPLILNFQTQRRNEGLSSNYVNEPLSMGEV